MDQKKGENIQDETEQDETEQRPINDSLLKENDLDTVSKMEPSTIQQSTAGITSLLLALSVKHDSSGAITVCAPPEAAPLLATLFEGFAKLLRGHG